MIDLFSKLAHMVLTVGTATALKTARFNHNVWWRHYELPKVIVLDSDPMFRSAFWRYFFGKVEIKLTFSTNFHPNTCDQTERVNGVLNQ